MKVASVEAIERLIERITKRLFFIERILKMSIERNRMTKKKLYLKILCIVSFLCWIATIVPSAYVLYNAYDSMDGTLHGFNGEMLYGMDAFIDTILMYIAFLFPFFLLWVLCLLGAIVSTVGMIYIRRIYRC